MLQWQGVAQAFFVKKQKTEKKEKNGNNNGQLRIATSPRVAHTKPPGPRSLDHYTI